jgi:hypothetical protein
MDRGANGGILGNDARVPMYMREVDTGIDNHELNAQVDAAPRLSRTKGPRLVLSRQYAHH